jgi:hypothetical protein
VTTRSLYDVPIRTEIQFGPNTAVPNGKVTVTLFVGDERLVDMVLPMTQFLSWADSIADSAEEIRSVVHGY